MLVLREGSDVWSIVAQDDTAQPHPPGKIKGLSVEAGAPLLWASGLSQRQWPCSGTSKIR